MSYESNYVGLVPSSMDGGLLPEKQHGALEINVNKILS